MANSGVCQACETDIRIGARFCHECGKPVVPSVCPHGHPLQGHERFCPSCGAKVMPSTAESTIRKSEEAICLNCAHFREATPVSSLMSPWGNAKMNEQLLKIKEDENKQRISEAKQKVEMIKISRKEWGFRPLLSNYCAAHQSRNIYEICELKNRANDCSDFQATPRSFANCSNCIHRMDHGDPYLELHGVHSPEIHSKMKEGIDGEGAVEMATLYHSQGEYPSMPRFHDWCRYLTIGGRYAGLPYPNVHSDCPHHELHEGESASFLS